MVRARQDIYKIFVKDQYLYCARIGGQLLDYRPDNNKEEFYNSKNIEDIDFIGIDKYNKKLNVYDILEIDFDENRSKWTGPYHNYGKMEIAFKDGSMMRFIIIINDISLVREILKTNMSLRVN